jgi:hypothetical protein
VNSTGSRQADAGGVERGLLVAQQRLQRLQARSFRLPAPGRRAGGGRAGARRIFEAVGLGEADLADQRHRGLEIRVGLAGVADDEIRRQREIRPRRAQPVDEPR